MKQLVLLMFVFVLMSFTNQRPKVETIKTVTKGITPYKVENVCQAPFGRFTGKREVVAIPFRRYK